MKKIKIAHFLVSTFWTGWRCWAAWTVGIGTIFLLGALRTATDADFTFASLAILPVLAIAWIGGRNQGLLAAFLASAMWTVADLVTERQFTTPWIPWTNAATRLMTYGLVALLAAQVRRQFEREHTHATRDALTGLHNRRMFLEYGAAEVERAKSAAHSVSVIFLDLDDFKQLNDAQGHDAGDAALRATAKALLGSLRASDGVARLGGDEFAILLAEIDYADAVKAGEKILREVNAALENFSPVKASLGVAWFAAADRLFPAMLKAADGLMYEVKESGKGDVLARRFAAPKPGGE